MFPESVQRAPKTGGRWQVTGDRWQVFTQSPMGQGGHNEYPALCLEQREGPCPSAACSNPWLPLGNKHCNHSCCAKYFLSFDHSSLVMYLESWVPAIHIASHAAHFGDGVFLQSCSWQWGQPWEQPAGFCFPSEWTYTPPIRSPRYFHSMRPSESQKRAAMTTAKMKWSEKTGYAKGSHCGCA